MMIATLALVAALTPPKQLDSQLVLRRYEARLTATKDPQTLVFMYAVSQAGPQDIDQTHRVYRSGNLVRDETLVVDGVKQKTTRIARYRNRYTLHDLAPHASQYVFLIVRSIAGNGRYDYLYRAVRLGAPASFTVRTLTIDGKTFLPREIRFHSVGAGARGDGTLAFTPAGKYWVPLSIAVQGTVNGRAARERIMFSAYQFPPSLPQSTFHSPRALPPAVLPTF
jgi:hypothetical protein